MKGRKSQKEMIYWANGELNDYLNKLSYYDAIGQ